MWRKLLSVLFLFTAVSLFGAPPTLHLRDVPRVLDRFFSYHIENKDLSPVIIRRTFKVFIEQFDPDKSYLLSQEAVPYLQMSDAKVAEVLERCKRGDYSDFLALNQLFQKAVYRSQALRAVAEQELVQTEIVESMAIASIPSRFAATEAELTERQKIRMVRFYLYHRSRTEIGSLERKAKVFTLFERKVRRAEANILLQTPNGDPLAKEMVEHFLATKILKSFAKSLDTHTAFFSPEEAHEMRMSLEKQFEGVGVVLSEGIDGVMIAELIKGSPAEQSGKIQVNDLLVEIDGKSIGQASFEEVLEMLKKKDKSEVILGFKRYGSPQESYFRVELRRQPIAMTDERIETGVEKFGDGVIGKIALHSFYENSDGVSSERDIKEAIKKFREQGEVYGLILDLRENSGGFLSQAVKVAGLFISNGIVVVSKYGRGEKHYLRNIAGRPFYSGPVVILTSKMSASAAEIVAQALQDYGVAVVVGDERTFGKGSIQFQTVTDEKADLFFKVTVGRYYTPSGKSTQIDGVIADIHVPTQYAPYNIGERFLEYPLPPDAVDPVFNDPLTDLDERAQRIFQQRYLPFLQRVVQFWKKSLPQLRKNSAQRMSRNPDFQAFLRKAEKARARQLHQPPNTIDEPIRIGLEDLQMSEAVNIVKDMIQIETDARSREETLAPTGS
jgi:carboxyl-terminal processing protease